MKRLIPVLALLLVGCATPDVPRDPELEADAAVLAVCRDAAETTPAVQTPEVRGITLAIAQICDLPHDPALLTPEHQWRRVGEVKALVEERDRLVEGR